MLGKLKAQSCRGLQAWGEMWKTTNQPSTKGERQRKPAGDIPDCVELAITDRVAQTNRKKGAVSLAVQKQALGCLRSIGQGSGLGKPSRSTGNQSRDPASALARTRRMSKRTLSE